MTTDASPVAAVQTEPSTDAKSRSIEATRSQRLEPALSTELGVGSTFCGRAVERAVLQRCLRAADRHQGGIVLIDGEPGIGKTRLAEEVARDATAAEATVLWGRCWDGDGAPPFWPWIQVLRGCQRGERNDSKPELGSPEIGHVLRKLGAVVPERLSLEPDESRFHLFDVVSHVLQDVSRNRLLLILLDDLHWADPASLLLLQFLAAEISSARILIVGTYRDEGILDGSLLYQVRISVGRHRWTQRLSLSGLSSVEIREFIYRVTGTKPDGRILGRLAERTGGNPFFLTETARLFELENRESGLPRGWTLRELPESIRDAVERRLGILPKPSVEMLRHASVIGQDFDLSLLATQVGESVDEVSATLDHTIKDKLIIPLPDGAGHYRFAHALVRDVLYDQVPSTLRERWHAQLAASLDQGLTTDDESQVAAIAYHYSLAGASGDPEKALEYSIRAGKGAAATLAHEEAANHYRRALRCSAGVRLGRTERCELLLALGEAQRSSGNWELARATFREAAGLARQICNPALLARSAIGFRAFVAPAPVDQEAVALLREALSVVSDDERLRVELLAALTFSLYWDPDPATVTNLSNEAMTIARHVDDPRVLSEALETRTTALVGRCNPYEHEQLAAEAVRLAEVCSEPGRAFRCRMIRYRALLEMGRKGPAEAEFQQCSRLARDLRYPRYLWQAAVIEAARVVTRGQFTLGQQLIDEAQQAGQYFDGPTAAQYRIIQQTLLLYVCGEISAAGPALRGVVDAYPDVALTHAALANACSASGDLRETREVLEWFGWSELQGVSGLLFLFTLALTAEAASVVRDGARAQVLYWLLQPHAGENVVVSWGAGLLGSVSHYLGLLAASLDQFDQAARHFDDALVMNTQMQMPALVACTQRRYAEMLLKRDRAGDRRRAEQLLEQALATAEDLSMSGHQQAIRATLADLAGGTGQAQICAGANEAYGGDGEDGPAREDAATSRTHGAYLFRREADFWTVAFEGSVLRLRHTRGLAVLSVLLQRPETEVHVFDLLSAVNGLPAGPETTNGRRPSHALGALPRDAGPLLDARARTEYRRRLHELRDELAEAEGFNDLGRVSTLRGEVAQLTEELQRAYGKAGRPRMADSAIERARISVRNNIAYTLRTLKRSDAALWRHMKAAVRTGTFCCYQPERTIPWAF